jgi:hypothetical protein
MRFKKGETVYWAEYKSPSLPHQESGVCIFKGICVIERERDEMVKVTDSLYFFGFNSYSHGKESGSAFNSVGTRHAFIFPGMDHRTDLREVLRDATRMLFEDWEPL